MLNATGAHPFRSHRYVCLQAIQADQSRSWERTR